MGGALAGAGSVSIAVQKLVDLTLGKTVPAATEIMAVCYSRYRA
jgi:hypothetical protein